ncbi:MAG: PrsW family intramembrane metalloprotease [Dehalococcoidales bacterium]|jgi:RsiW-degrading membrane proteinase PrsW (M82 family)
MTKIFAFMNQRWFQVLVIGAILFFGTEQALKFTNNINFVPTVILIGAFLVPVTMVTYFYSQEQVLDKTSHSAVPLSLVATCFLVGGVIGSVFAGFIEYTTLRSSSILILFGVGLIEETTKLIFPVIMFIRGRYRSEADGLLFGVSCGMGFAALETMGYGLVSLLQTQGNIGTLQEVLLIRGLLSPVGHAAWTGLVCAVLWRQREKTGKILRPVVFSVFLLAVVLHALWDISGTSSNVTVNYLGYSAVGVVSLTLLILRLRDARKVSMAAKLPSVPPLG